MKEITFSSNDKEDVRKVTECFISLFYNLRIHLGTAF